MPQTYKTSVLIILSLLFLLPIFFIPGGALNLDISKSALLLLGVIAAVLVSLLEIWRAEKLDMPWHPLILIAALLPLVYLLSALLSTPSSLSLLGYNLEVDTFGFILLGVSLMILSATIFKDTIRVLQALVAFLISISVVTVFMVVKILSHAWAGQAGGIPVWGIFFGNTANPVGRWTDLAVVFGLLSVVLILGLGMIPMKKSIRLLSYGIFGLSTALLLILNFSTAFILTLGTSVFLSLYFSRIEKHFFHTAPTLPQASAPFILRPIFLPIVLGVVSLLFLINPTVSSTHGTLGNVVTNIFQLENVDVRPSFSATLDISKAVLSQVTLLGSGPNTFGRDWLIYKPASINTTPFWAVAFPFGAGFIPTQIATTGILGSALWLAFFILLVLTGIKALSRIPESRAERFALISTLLVTLFLWTSSFLYTPSLTVLVLAFLFSGFFVAASRRTGIIPSRVTNLKESPQTRFGSIFFLAVITLGTLFLGWAGLERTVSAFYFQKAVNLSNTAGASLTEIENELNKALKFSPLDTYYIALSRINLAKAQVATNSTSTAKENQAIFEGALRKSIETARAAISVNPNGYQNWVSLGAIYSALVPAPLSVDGAYENARFAYSEALKRNPTNPELPLLSAQLELNKGNVEAARSFIRSSLALKEDYADAYLMLARLEIGDNNIAGAITSTERLALLVPNNAGLYFELGLLKYSNKDYLGAIQALTLSLSVTPDYANAKYYLGLALAQLGRLEEAQTQFEALAQSNPDSEELEKILEELRAGKKTFLDSLKR